MKTRRILAASTAALLAFGTTAIISTVASAAAAASGVSYGGSALTATEGVYEVPADAAASGTLTITLTGVTNLITTAPDASSGAAGTSTLVEIAGKTVTVSGSAITIANYTPSTTEDTLSIVVTTYTDDGSAVPTAGSPATVDVKVIKADGGSEDDGAPESLTTTLFVNFNSDGEATLLSGGEGAVKSVKASITDKAAAKFDTDEYEDYKIYGDVDTFDAVSGKVDVSDDQSNGTIKGLDKPLKREIGKIKNTEFAIVNLNIADGDKVKTSTPEPVTFTIRTTFDAKVYHVTGKTVELIKSDNAKIVGGNYDVTFTTKNFSPFILTKATLANAGATTSDGTPTSTATSNSGTSTNPDTGIALAIAPVVLAAGAVAVVALKKKH